MRGRSFFLILSRTPFVASVSDHPSLDAFSFHSSLPFVEKLIKTLDLNSVLEVAWSLDDHVEQS